MDRQTADADKRIEGIFELHRYIVSMFFKDFEDTFEPSDGLNFTHIKAAMTLYFHGKMTMSELSRRLVLEKGSFTPVAAKLIKTGYIKKEQTPADKRAYNLVLTASGKELTARLKNAHWRFMTAALGQLPPDEQDDYFELIRKLNRYNARIKEANINR